MGERINGSEIILAGFPFRRTGYREFVKYDIVGSDFLSIESSKKIGSLGGEWRSHKGLGFFLGLINRQIGGIEPSLVLREADRFLFTVNSSLTHEEPSTATFKDPDLEMPIPFRTLTYKPPLTIDTLVELGHYSHEGNPDVQLNFLSVDTPRGFYTYTPFQEGDGVGAKRWLDSDNWRLQIEEMGEFMDETSNILRQGSGQQILQGIVNREYPQGKK